MKIYLAAKRVEHYINKFIPELIRGLEFAGNEVGVGTDILWTESVFQYDIVYFHWPEFLFNNASDADCERLNKRIKEIKDARIVIAAHCHNLKPHDPTKKVELKLYEIVYGSCDVMIHMGAYSLKKMRADYPKSKHFFVPHHIYSHFCQFGYDKIQSRRVLDISEKKCVVLCFGAFRNEKERNLFLTLRKMLNRDEYEMVAPSFVRGKVVQKNIVKGLKNLINIIAYRMKGVKFSTKYINDDDMQRYFCASDIVLIQRPDILNSGNLPMGFAAGKVVVGPDVGNIPELLALTRNPVFEVNNVQSLKNAVEKARILACDSLGLRNKKYAEDNWSPEIIGKALTSIFTKVRDE